MESRRNYRNVNKIRETILHTRAKAVQTDSLRSIAFEESENKATTRNSKQMLQNALPKNRKLCYSVIEADGLSGTNVALKTTVSSDGENIRKNQGFDIGRMYKIPGAKKCLQIRTAREKFIW